MTSRPVKLKSVTRLVGQVEGGDGINVVKAGGVFTVSLDNPGFPSSVVDDANVTGDIAGAALTLGWNGVLSAARGGTGGTLPVANGGTAGTTQAQAQNGLGLRINATGTVTYYVRKDGSDANTGLADTAGGAKLTINAAIVALSQNNDLRANQAVVQVRAGTYTEDVGLVPIPGATNGGAVYLRGDTATPSNVVIAGTSCAVRALGVMQEWFVEGFKITSSAIGINGHAGGWIRLGVMEFGACTDATLQADHRGTVELQGAYTISGASQFFAYSANNGYILNAGVLGTVTGTPAFTVFAYALGNSYQAWSGATFSGSATGTRYGANTGSGINTSGGGANFFPGNGAGSADAASFGYYA